MHQKSPSLEKCRPETRFITPVWLWGSLVKRQKQNASSEFQVLSQYLFEYTNQEPYLCPPFKQSLHGCFRGAVPTKWGKWVLRFALWFSLESTNAFLIHTCGLCTKKYPEEKVSDVIAGKFVITALCIKIIILDDNFYYFTQSPFNLIIIYHSSIPFPSC